MVVERYFYGARGTPISLVEERGRRFWSASVPDPSGWSLPQEFCSREDAMRYVDDKLEANRRYAENQRRALETKKPAPAAAGRAEAERGVW